MSPPVWDMCQWEGVWMVVGVPRGGGCWEWGSLIGES